MLTWWTAREVVDFDFVAWDDDYNILVNPHLGPPNVGTLRWMFTDTEYMRRYIPFGWLGFSVAYGVSGLSPSAYHTANLLLHVSNAFLLFLIIVWILRRWVRAAVESRLEPCAAAGALFWALHPLRAETVGWSSGLLYSLATFFALSSVLTYSRTLGKPTGVGTAVALLLYAISILTYPITVGLVTVFLGLEIAEARRTSRHPVLQLAWKRISLRVLPFLTASLAGMMITVIARLTATGIWTQAPTLDDVGIIHRLTRGGYSVIHYFQVTLWPLNLTTFPTQLYDFYAYGSRALLSASALLGITWLCWRHRTRHGGALLLWIIFLALIAPMLGFTEKIYHPSDRYTYLPAMTAGVAVAALLATCAHRSNWVIGITTALALFALMTSSSSQLRIWRDSPSLFARSAAAAANSPLASDVYHRWAIFHSARGNVPGAKAVLAWAEHRGLHPAIRQLMVGNIEQAELEIRAGTLPLVARIHTELARQLAMDGRNREAEEQFATAVAVVPHSALLRFNQAMHAALQGNPRRALELLHVALARPDGTVSPTAQRQAWSMIAQAFANAGEPTLARAAERRAQSLPHPQ